jgi:glycine/D-amino acid oxidase-like deaminating enzyme
MPDLVDVVVVGAGILGASLAWELTRRNFRVALLDAGRPGGGTTGASFAWINGTSKFEGAAYHRLNALARDHYDALARGAESGIGLHVGGALIWADPRDAARLKSVRERARRLQEWGYPVTTLTAAEMKTLEPRLPIAPDAEGMFAPADRWLDTPRAVGYFVREAVRLGCDLRAECPATGFTLDIRGAISTVECPKGRIATRCVVVAAGIATPELVGRAAGNAAAANWTPIDPVPGLLLEVPAGASGMPIGRVLYPPDSGWLHMRPTASGGVLAGADDTDALCRTDREAAVKLLARRTAEALGCDAAQVGPAPETRLSVRPIPRDGLPIVGSIPDVPGLFAAVTHSGVTLGPLLMQNLASEIATGRPLELQRPYLPSRFPAHG